MTSEFFPQKKYLTKSPVHTKEIGIILAKKILKLHPRSKRAFVLGLEGDLGGGKTTFLQGFAKGLGIKEKILSPSFVIIKRFKIKYLRFKFQNFYHIDCYRIKKPKELLVIGFKEIISDPKNIIAVEWADRVSEIIPPHSLTLRFRFINAKSREIKILKP